MKYLYLYIAIAAPFLFYIAFIVGKIVYAVKFSGMPDVEHGNGEKTFGEGKKLRYIAAGDSLAIGVGASSVENTFTHKIAETLGKNYGVIYKNIAVRGAKTNNVIEKQLPEIISFNPDVVIMTVGGNDALRFFPKGWVEENYKEIIDRIRNETNATLYITNIPNFSGTKMFPRWFVQLIEWRIMNINSGIDTLAEDRVVIVDAHGKWYEASDIDGMYATDGFHANDYGYEYWADSFLEYIKAYPPRS